MDKERDGSLGVESTDQVVGGIVTKVKESSIIVRLKDSRVGELPKVQCYDYVSDANAEWEQQTKGSQVPTKLSVGAEVKVMALSRAGTDKKDKRKLTLTMKPALIATTKIKSSKYEDKDVPALPSAFSDMYPGQLVVGYVLKAEAYGVVVRFRDLVTGLCPTRSLPPHPKGESVSYEYGDTIVARVSKIDVSKQPPRLCWPVINPMSFRPRLLSLQAISKQMLVKFRNGTFSVLIL